MTQHEQRSAVSGWTKISILSGLIGGVSMILTGIALLSVLNEASSRDLRRLPKIGRVFSQTSESLWGLRAYFSVKELYREHASHTV